MNGFRCLVAGCLLALPVLFGGTAGAEVGTRKILLLCSYHRGDPWTDRVVEGFFSEIRGHVPVDIFVEFLDARRRPLEQVTDFTEEFLRRKYQDAIFDVVACADDAALDFLLARRSALFPGVPLVFCGINDFTPARVAGHDGITGVNEAPDLRGTLELLLALRPETGLVVAVGADVSVTHRANLDRYFRLRNQFSGRLNFRECLNVTETRLPAVLGALPENAAVLALTTLPREDGTEIPLVESGRVIVRSSPVPVMCFWDFDFGIGTLGGRVVSGLHQGRAAAGLVRRILDGESASAIPVLKSPNQAVIDWEVFQRFRLDPNRIPPDATVVGKTPSPWERYRPWLLGIAIFLFFQTVLIVLLLTARIRQERLEKQREAATEALRESERRFRVVFECSRVGFLILDGAGVVRECNRHLAGIFDAKMEDYLGMSLPEKLPDGPIRQSLLSAMNGAGLHQYEGTHTSIITGKRLNIHIATERVASDMIIVIVEDVTWRRKMEEAHLFLSHCGYRNPGENFFESLARYLAELLEMDYVCIDRLEGDRLVAHTVAIYVDGHFEPNVSYTLDDTPCGEVLKKDVCRYGDGVRHLFPRDLVLQEMGAESYVGVTLWNFDGNPIGLIAVIGRHPLTETELAASILRRVSTRAAWELERIRAEAARQELEDRLRQSQKMESVGRLAGGVAHDFNNMLNIIIGYSELASLNLEPGHPVRSDIREIMDAARRAADLTRQLLAFARKQAVKPKVLRLNEIIAAMLRMLRRLIAEDIDLSWELAGDLWSVKMDPAQVDQILANLVVNAGDAIAGTGRIVIGTANATLDEVHGIRHPDAKPGDYVLLWVRDDGRGMTPEIRDRIFEPFFTTKEFGKGTGLGLATVHGIVTQNDGFITVDSHPGKGSTFTIHLPRHDEAPEGEILPPPSVKRGGSETILLVEDEPALLEVGERMLRQLGYAVLATTSPDQAVRLAGEHPGEIHLLMSDVVMPEMNGRDLRDRVTLLRPGIQTLFMSGYTADIIARQGVLDQGMCFLHKPFSRDELARKLREVLDAPSV